MRQTAKIISTYSADVFGVCSALFELGGLVVMHDASGCNSTYTTHDEPRWFDMDSMVYISGISEMEAIMGDDEKLLGDIAAAAAELHPKFIAIAGTPIPMMTGFDYAAAAAILTQRTGIPAFGFPTTGMGTYVAGASMALEAIARQFVNDTVPKTDMPSANILGLTPLDFSTNGTDTAIADFLEREGFAVCSRWAMGSSLEELSQAGAAHVNLVVSAAGMQAAEFLRERHGTPWVAGVPVGKAHSRQLAADLRGAAASGSCLTRRGRPANPKEKDIVILGEGVTSLSLAEAIQGETGRDARVICATECPSGLLRAQDAVAWDEDEIIPLLQGAKTVIADPLYAPICPPEAQFVPLAHEAFSGRIYRDEIPNLTTDFQEFLKMIASAEEPRLS